MPAGPAGKDACATSGTGFLGEFVEQSVFAVVGGPNGGVVAEGDAALGGLPEGFGIGMFGEFVEADVAAIDGHGLGMGREGDDTGAVVEFDVADLNLVGESGGMELRVEAVDFEVIFATGDDGAGEVKEFGELVNLVHVFEGAGPIFGGKEVVAILEAEALTHVFEPVAEGPADADGFFDQSNCP